MVTTIFRVCCQFLFLTRITIARIQNNEYSMETKQKIKEIKARMNKPKKWDFYSYSVEDAEEKWQQIKQMFVHNVAQIQSFEPNAYTIALNYRCSLCEGCLFHLALVQSNKIRYFKNMQCERTALCWISCLQCMKMIIAQNIWPVSSDHNDNALALSLAWTILWVCARVRAPVTFILIKPNKNIFQLSNNSNDIRKLCWQHF